MTISGEPPSDAIDGVRFTLASQAQEYIRKLADEISTTDGSPLYLAEDIDSGTSTDFIARAETTVHLTGRLQDTLFANLLQACVRHGNTFRERWWGSGATRCHQP